MGEECSAMIKEDVGPPRRIRDVCGLPRPKRSGLQSAALVLPISDEIHIITPGCGEGYIRIQGSERLSPG